MAPGRWLAPLVVVSLLAGPVVAAHGAASGAPRGGLTAPPGPKLPTRPRTAFLPHGRPLPDSVLAVVGDRTVTASKFMAAWSSLRPPARPDTLTPQAAKEFLDLLIDKEALGQVALREDLRWSPRESLSFAGYRDRLVLRARLDSLLGDVAAARAAAGDTLKDRAALEIAARDSVMLAIHARYDGMLASQLALRWAALPRPVADSSFQAQIRMMGELPKVDAADTSRTLAWSDEGKVEVRELLEHWRMTDPLTRPRIENSEHLQNLAANALFERWLRRTARELHFEERPALAAQIATRREFLAVSHYVQREVDAHLPDDDATQRRWYDAHVEDFRLPAVVHLVQLVLPDRASASDMFVRLREVAQAESLVLQGRRAGVEYRATVTEDSDSSTFRRALQYGAGAVLGPDSTSRGWRVARVVRIETTRLRTFEEARELVRHQQQQVEGERLMQELLARVRKQMRLVLNDRAIARLSSAS